MHSDDDAYEATRDEALEAGLTSACPECDSTKVLSYTNRSGWRCHACGATFDTPISRPKHNRASDGYDTDGIPASAPPHIRDAIKRMRGDEDE